jgi:hypothetical protein
MIKFFRNIRKKLAAENKVASYLRYAVGEIFLVVVGILIALQINNWNENRKTDSKIINSLIALKDDLVNDTLLIVKELPEVITQYQLNENLRKRVAKPGASLDTLVKISRFEFNPNWYDPIIYNTNAYNSLNETGLIENLKATLKEHIKNFYNEKFYRLGMVTKTTVDYRTKVSGYVDKYTFGSTSIHDQGLLIDSLVWNDIDPAHLAASFQGISNFKRILFRLTKDEMEYSLSNSRKLIQHIYQYLNEND